MPEDLNGAIVEPVGGPPSESAPNPSLDTGIEPTPSGGVTSEPDAFTDLNALSPEERESPRIKKALSDYFAKTREAAPWRKLSERLGGKTPEEIEATFRNYEQGQQIAEALQKLAGENKPPENELPPELQANPYLNDPDARAAVEYIASQQVKPLQAAQKERDQAAMIQAAQSACTEFAKANPELNLTAQQLYDTCIKGKHNPFTQLYQAAIDAAGGPDKFLAAKNKTFLEGYQKQALENRKKSGTVVSPTAPVGTGTEQPGNWDDHFELMQERARANRAARLGG